MGKGLTMLLAHEEVPGVRGNRKREFLQAKMLSVHIIL